MAINYGNPWGNRPPASPFGQSQGSQGPWGGGNPFRNGMRQFPGQGMGGGMGGGYGSQPGAPTGSPVGQAQDNPPLGGPLPPFNPGTPGSPMTGGQLPPFNSNAGQAPAFTGQLPPGASMNAAPPGLLGDGMGMPGMTGSPINPQQMNFGPFARWRGR